MKIISGNLFQLAARRAGFFAIGAFLFCRAVPSMQSAVLPTGFTETQFGTDLNGTPTAMDFAPDGRLFVCLQEGRLRVIENGTLLTTPFVTLPTSANGERGLLGIAFDPDFANNQFVYVYYTVTTSPVHNRISRFTANGNVAVQGSETVIVDLDNLSSATNHNGGAIHFGPDGKLYAGVGENANPANAQSIGNRLGKLLRINADGSIPSDNPTSFPGIAGSPSGANQAIWAAGLRNPFTFAFQPGTGRLFINDVGQSTWEEINDGIAGSNYGWDICEGACSPPDPTYRDPLFQYSHSGQEGGCAIVGGAFYNPVVNQFPATYTGKYFFADLCSGWIRLMNPADNTATDFATEISMPVLRQECFDTSRIVVSAWIWEPIRRFARFSRDPLNRHGTIAWRKRPCSRSASSLPSWTTVPSPTSHPNSSVTSSKRKSKGFVRLVMRRRAA